MKIQDIYHLLQVALLLLLAACTKEELSAIQDEAQQLSITVTDGGYISATSADPNASPTTRTVEKDYATEFTTGDACGLYVVRGSQMIYSNVKLTAERDAATGNIVWKPDDGTMLSGGLSDEHYYLYYPYQANMDGKTATVPPGATLTDVSFFRPLVNSWQPQDDQSTHAAYTASDLMTAKGTAAKDANNTLRLSFSMTHRMALAVIEMPTTVYKFTDARIPDYTVITPTSFAGTAKPRRMEDAYRYVVHPNATSSPTIEGSYNGGNKEFSFTPSGLTAGKYKIYEVDNAPVTRKSYTIQVGDYLLTDGNLLPKDTPLTAEQKANVAAIVFWTPAETETTGRQTPASLTDDKIMAADFPACTHGLAVSFKNVSTAMVWQASSEFVKDFQNGTNFNPINKADYAYIASDRGATDNINRILGYQNTQVLLAYNAYCKANGKDDYIVLPVAALANFPARNPAPANSTGWFLPSEKELHMLCYKDVDDVYKQSNDTYIQTRDIVNASLQTAGGNPLGAYSYWSSSEDASYRDLAFVVELGNAYVRTEYKKGSSVIHGCRVRAVCAF